MAVHFISAESWTMLGSTKISSNLRSKVYIGHGHQSSNNFSVQVCIISEQDVNGCVIEHTTKTMDDNAYTCNTDGGNKILRNSD